MNIMIISFVHIRFYVLDFITLSAISLLFWVLYYMVVCPCESLFTIFSC